VYRKGNEMTTRPSLDAKTTSTQFTHFGVLDNGSQSKSSVVTAVVVNMMIALCAIIIGAAAKKTIDTRHKLTELTEPILMKKPVEPPVKIKVPKIPPPPVVKVEPPKIKLPDVKLPDVPKPPVIKMTQPMPVVLPAPPKIVQPPPAPKVVNLARAQPAGVLNNAPHTTAVALGSQTNPIAPSNRPSATAINLGNKGMSGMPASNNGMGASQVVNLGSGSAGSQNMKGRDNASGAVVGVKLGVTSGTGPMNAPGRAPGAVNLGQNAPPPMPKASGPSAVTAKAGPKVLFKPKPEYSEEARNLHIEGVVSVRLRVSSSGIVEVLSVTSDLGHGLGNSAIRAVQATRFQPATDASGHPIDWEGVVNVAFQLAG
jgi:periplasmic protein TonB